MSGKQKGDGKPNRNKNRANNKEKSKLQQENANKSNQKHKEKEKNTQHVTVKPVCETPIKTDSSKDDFNVQSPDVTEETPTPIQKKYSRRKIESNWTKPDLPENIYEAYESTSHGANLLELFNMPMKFGDHFEFKSEKNLLSESKRIESNDLFELDYKALGEYVSCVPFYEILGLESSMFPEHQVESMEKLAEQRRLKLLSSIDASNSEGINLSSFKTNKSSQQNFDSNNSQESKNSNTIISNNKDTSKYVNKELLKVKPSVEPVTNKNEPALDAEIVLTKLSNSIINDSIDNSDDELDDILRSTEISAGVTKLMPFQPSTNKKLSSEPPLAQSKHTLFIKEQSKLKDDKRTVSNDLENIVQLSNQLSSSKQTTSNDDDEDLEEWLNDHLKM